MDAALELNHIALLQHRAKNTGSTILFRLPVRRGSEPVQEWNNVTVAEFAADVDRVANFLMTELKARAIPPRSVVTMLYGGLLYEDLVYAIALARASYIPEMLCTYTVAHPEVVFGLMEKAGSKMIVYDPNFVHLTENCPFPKMAFKPVGSIEKSESSTVNGDSALPRVEDLSSGSDFCFIFLTSGSTSGMPKVVPFTQKSISIYYKTQFGIWLGGRRFDTQDAFLGRGSICFTAAMIQYLGCLYTGSCIVHPSKQAFATEELFDMVNVCGLNRVTSYGTYLAAHFPAAKKDRAILKVLQEMRTVSYGGVGISIADDEWCFQNSIPIIGMYATTECGLLMSSVPGMPSRFMRPVSGLSCTFDPVADTITQADNPGSTQLLEFVLLAHSPQIPQPHLVSTDGNFHSGDLFEKQPDGSYLYRGRNDDWIKSFSTDRIDAKAIEEKVYELCSDLVKQCVVVGHLRQSPALFIEVAHNTLSTMSDDGLKELILRRMKEFNARQLTHERITDKRLIFIVDEGALPRTMKGNFRRRGIEEKYSKELDAMYIVVDGDEY